MKCPYCDETVHLMSKFCPKCGLPLKDETTVMGGGGGAYLTDEAGPARWVILSAAGAIVVIALSIGWLNSRKPTDASQLARREPVPVNPAFTRPANPANMFVTNPANAFGGMPRSASPSANYSPQVRWAYVPPANPAPQYQPPVNPAPPAAELPPPAMILASNPIITPPMAPPKVEAAPVTTPAVPFADTVPAPINYPAGVVLTDPTSAYLSIPYGPAAMPAPPEEVNRTWVYDPVQERYVINPERVRHTMAPSRAVPRRRVPSAGNIPSINPATGLSATPADAPAPPAEN